MRELPGDAPDIKTRAPIGIREPHLFFRLSEVLRAHYEDLFDIFAFYADAPDAAAPPDRRYLLRLSGWATFVKDVGLFDDIAAAASPEGRRKGGGGDPLARRLVCLLYTSPSPRDS